MALREKVLCKTAAKVELKEKGNHEINPTLISSLDEMLHAVYAIRCPKPRDYDVRRDLVRVFNQIAKELYGNSNSPVVVEFGSFLMDIFDANSDLDLSVNFGNGVGEISRDKKIQTLRKFAKKFYALQSRGHVKGVHPITTAKVPILKVVDCGTGVECDISIQNKDGILKSQILNMISSIDDRFRKLSFLMKVWAKAHNINSSKDKTLNSLSIVLLVAFHLQTRNPPILPPFFALLKDGSDPTSVKKLCREYLNYGRYNNETLADLFVSLLIKLSDVQNLWPKGLCASVYEGCWASKTWNTKAGCISVEDFTDRSQNVARAVGASEVKTIYKCIHSSIQHLFTFMDGKIEGPSLMELLFGHNAMPNLVGTGISNFCRDAADASFHHEFTPAKQKHVLGSWDDRQAMPSNPLYTERIPHISGWRAMGSGSYERIVQSIPSNSVLETRIQQVDSWGGEPTGRWTGVTAGEQVRALEQLVAPDPKRTRSAGSWGQVPSERLPHLPIEECVGATMAKPFDFAGKQQKSTWVGAQQPAAGAWDRGATAFGASWGEETRPTSAWGAPTPRSGSFAQLRDQAPGSLNVPAVHPAPSRHPYQSSCQRNHWLSTNHRR